MITLRLYEPQARALLAAAKHYLRPPIRPLDVTDHACLARAIEALQNAIDDAPPAPLDRDLDRLATTLYGLKLGVLRDWAMQRVIAVHRIVALWRAGAELPHEVQSRVLQISQLAKPGWREEIEALLSEYGMRFDLPTADDFGTPEPGE